MMQWNILGIAPTKDKKAITAAYRARLKQTNPEEKPTEFQALRAAYEEALRLADQSDAAPIRDESPVGLWMERVKALYEDFPARIQSANWARLLSDDVCVGLDTRPLAEEALLKFLMEQYFLPQAVWQVLDDVFSFSERMEELCEQYPQDFIEHAVINGIHFAPSLPYELFTPGMDGSACDTYRRLYHQARQASLEELGGLLDQIEALPEAHPYGRALRCSWQMNNGQQEAGAAGFRALAEEYPDNAVLNIDWASVCMDLGSTDDAEAAARKVLSLTPGHIQAMQILASCLAAKGQLHEAKELTYDMMHAAADDPILVDQCAQRLQEWNETLIRQRLDTMERDPADNDNILELAWCYLQNERPADALETAAKISPDYEDRFAYHNLMGKVHLKLENCAEALPHLAQTETILRQMQPDGTAETAKRMARLPEMLQVQGTCLMQLGDQQQAMEKFEQALTLAPDDPKVLSVMGQIRFGSGDYEGCAEILQRLVRVSPGSWFGNVMLALSLYRLHRDGEAFDAVNRALSVQGSELSLYVIKMQILLRNGVFDEVHGVLDFLRDAGAPEDISLDWIRAQLTELEQKDTRKAFAQYQAIARRIEDGADMMDISQLYFRMAVLMGDQMNANRAEDRQILLDVVEKGLSHEKFDEDCLSYKAWLLKKDGRLDEAIEMYRELKTPAAEMKLAELYYGDLKRYAAQALECYESMLEKRQSAELYFYAATCRSHMGDYEGARRYYLRELALDDSDVDGYNGLAIIFEAQGQYAEALEQVNKAVSVMWENGAFYTWLIEHQVQILRRMGRHSQALRAVDDAMARQDYPAGFQLKFDVCCQFGLWEDAKQVLDQWQKARRGDSEQIKAAANLHLFTGKLFKAAMTMGKVKRKMDFEEEQDFRLQLAELEGNPKRAVQIWSRRAAETPESDHVLMSLALAQWWSGDRRSAVQTAEKALALLDETLKLHLADEALFRSRRAVVLAILGRTDEARAELDAVRKLPLCEYCTYGSCKDADIFEAYIEELTGNAEKAMALYRTGRTQWPDELDFASGEVRMKRKGK